MTVVRSTTGMVFASKRTHLAFHPAAVLIGLEVHLPTVIAVARHAFLARPRIRRVRLVLAGVHVELLGREAETTDHEVGGDDKTDDELRQVDCKLEPRDHRCEHVT